MYEMVKFLNEPFRISSFLGFVGPIRCQIWIHQTFLHYVDGHVESNLQRLMREGRINLLLL